MTVTKEVLESAILNLMQRWTIRTIIHCALNIAFILTITKTVTIRIFGITLYKYSLKIMCTKPSFYHKNEKKIVLKIILIVMESRELGFVFRSKHVVNHMKSVTAVC